jgi:hypothetical protein
LLKAEDNTRSFIDYSAIDAVGKDDEGSKQDEVAANNGR